MDSRFSNTSLQLRLIRSRHRPLPTSPEEENQLLKQLQLDQEATNTPFTLARGATLASRKPLDRFDNQIFRDHIACFLVNTNASLSVVENPSFQQLLLYCNPSAKMISRRTASRDIKALYNKLQPRIQAMLQEYTVIQKAELVLLWVPEPLCHGA